MSDILICKWLEKYAQTFCKLYQNYYIKSKYFGSAEVKAGDLESSERAFYYLRLAVEVLSTDSEQKRLFIECIANQIKYANLFVLYHNKIAPEAIKNAIGIKKKIIQKEPENLINPTENPKKLLSNH